MSGFRLTMVLFFGTISIALAAVAGITEGAYDQFVLAALSLACIPVAIGMLLDNDKPAKIRVARNRHST